jgi:integrase
MKREERFKTGSVVFDKRRKTWNFLQWIDGKRRTKRIGTLAEYRTKGAAQRAAQAITTEVPKLKPSTLTVSELVEHYRAEKMPQRFSTRRSYNAWLKNRVLPRWGKCSITDLQPRPVQLWLDSLDDLAPKSRAHLRMLLHCLWEYAQWRGDAALQRNPMELVTIRNASKRTRKPRSLSVDEFRKFLDQLAEPFRTIALLCCCLGLRISECLALKWSDVDWLQGTLLVERGIVRQNVDDVKTDESRKKLVINPELLTILKTWKQQTQFATSSDWIFASPSKIGRLPWSYPHILQVFYTAGKNADIGRLSTHTMRHTYRTWLDSVGTPVGVQQGLMRHADIRTTMNQYGAAMTPDMIEAHGKIVGLALNGLPADCAAS